MAVCSRRAATGNAGDWILKRRVAWSVRAEGRCIPPRSERSRLCRGQERGDRKPLGGGTIRSIACAGGRSGWPPGRGDRDLHRCRGTGGETATTTIPIVFINGGDPVRAGIVPSLNRPGGNVTGASFFGVDLAPKQLALAHEVVPNAQSSGFGGPERSGCRGTDSGDAGASRTLGLQLVVQFALTASDIDTAFATFVRERAGALVVGTGALLTNQRKQIIALATRHAADDLSVSRVCRGWRLDQLRQQRSGYLSPGWHLCRADFKGDKPADLPVILSTKFEFVLNLKAAKTLGLTVSPTLLARVDEVIE